MPYLNNLLFKPYDKKFINQIENSLIDKYHLRKYLNKVFPYNILHFLDFYNNNLFLLLEDDNVVGSILLRNRVSTHSLKKFWWIYSVYIKENCRRKGYGKIIMDKSIAWLTNNNSEAVYLYVDRKNIKAISLYEKMNFKIIEKSKYHKIDSKQYLMEKTISV